MFCASWSSSCDDTMACNMEPTRQVTAAKTASLITRYNDIKECVLLKEDDDDVNQMNQVSFALIVLLCIFIFILKMPSLSDVPKHPWHRRLLAGIRGTCVVSILLFLSLMFSSIFIVASTVLILFQAFVAQRRLAGMFQQIWSNFTIAAVWWLVPTELVLYWDEKDTAMINSRIGAALLAGNPKALASNDLVMANHQIYADWIYIWALLNRAGRAGAVKIVMKRSLQFLPIVGLGMKLLDFIFIHRNWQQDRVKFLRRIQRLAWYPIPYTLLFFPEGTTINDKVLARSNEYARKNDLETTHNVLLPRVTGLQAVLESLSGSLEGVLDLTIGYTSPYGSRDLVKDNRNLEDFFGLVGLFFGAHAPRQVHIYLRYYPIESIPSNDDRFGRWLQDRYYEKDLMLKEFFEKGRFPGCPRPIPLANRRSCIYGILCVTLTISVLSWIVLKIAQ